MKSDQKSLEDWKAIIPEEWHNDISDLWDDGCRRFGKFIVHGGEIDRDGRRFSQPRILDDKVDSWLSPYPLPEHHHYSFASSRDGKAWHRIVADARVAKIDNLGGEYPHTLVDVEPLQEARRLAKNHLDGLAKFLKFGNQDESLAADHCAYIWENAFRVAESAGVGDAALMAFRAGMLYQKLATSASNMEIRARVSKMSPGANARHKNEKTNPDWRWIIKTAVERHPDFNPTEILRVLDGTRGDFFKNAEGPLKFADSSADLVPIEWGDFRKIVKKAKE